MNKRKAIDIIKNVNSKDDLLIGLDFFERNDGVTFLKVMDEFDYFDNRRGNIATLFEFTFFKNL